MKYCREIVIYGGVGVLRRRGNSKYPNNFKAVVVESENNLLFKTSAASRGALDPTTVQSR